MPDVIKLAGGDLQTFAGTGLITEENWRKVDEAVTSALDACENHYDF